MYAKKTGAPKGAASSQGSDRQARSGIVETLAECGVGGRTGDTAHGGGPRRVRN